MLPVILFERDDALRQILLDAALERACANRCDIRLKMATNACQEAAKAAKEEDGVVLFLAGPNADNVDQIASIARDMLARCRDSYPFFWVRQAGVLERVLRGCPRPAGILLPPVTQERAKDALQQVFQDYLELIRPREEQILLNFGASMRRLPRDTITHIEARDKKIIIYTQRQCFSVYGTVAEMESRLCGAFIRCHRAFLVNPKQIDSIDFSLLSISVHGGAVIPISRSRREDVRRFAEAENHSRSETDRLSENETIKPCVNTINV